VLPKHLSPFPLELRGASINISDFASNEGSRGQLPNDEVKVVNLDRVVTRPALVLGLVGATFFLIGGAATAVVAMLLAVIPGIVATWVMSGESTAVARRSADLGRRYDGHARWR
jgi:hypothetical protein